MVMGGRDLEQEQNENELNTGLGGELRELEDMDESGFDGGLNINSMNGSFVYDNSRKNTNY